MRAADLDARRWVSRASAGVVIAATVTALIGVVLIDRRLVAAGRADLRSLDGAGVAFTVALVTAATVGAWLLVRRPEHPVGWCFSLLAVGIAAAGLAESYASYGLFVRPSGLPADDLAALVSSVAFVVWLVAIALICSLTPDGRHLSPRWRWASRAMVVAAAVWLVTKVVSPAPLEAPFADRVSPWATDLPAVGGVRFLSALATNVLVLVAVVSLLVRFRRSRGDERRRLSWMAVVAGPFFGLVVVVFVAAVQGREGVVNAAAAGFVALPPIGALLSIERYRLYDVDRIVSRSVGWVLVSSLMVAIYAAVAVVSARLLDEHADRGPTAVALATLSVVLAFRPVHLAVQDLVDRRFARRRHDAIRRMRTFVADPSTHPSVEVALGVALDDPSVRVAYPNAEIDGWVAEDGRVLEVTDAWRRVERGGRTVAAIDHAGDAGLVHAVLEVAAPELDTARLRAAIALQLHEVVASRRRIAEAQLDERRRIERDLHDGAQQRLLGAAAQLQAALLNGASDVMRDALALGMAECRTAVVELRELANGLHPAVLADGGLAAAIEQLPARSPMPMHVDVPELRFPEKVEATLWFVTCEAVANALKHADATTVSVALSARDDDAHLVIADDGRGGATADGNGLRGLADRVEAMGGRFAVASGAGGGTRVEAVIPCGS